MPAVLKKIIKVRSAASVRCRLVSLLHPFPSSSRRRMKLRPFFLFNKEVKIKKPK